ncbi:hypothetical protein CMEL01_10531 [Colletotrichum melonis]|uniref:Uncharacterized protein n=2 Tax=Colletotrichum acutatum species complex TaxID=2707335 RepID=A0AAJ0E8U6_9PEZI|nr:uncharacterized protein CCOS01_01363 [Colletotrichum costaricense]KAK1446288.1 hypothetical protein CMEL01_10531 [Colletotrichum melonis]KAK1540049.1 hypothetical protein CCOS01_01363 [Colletotrichum costaricense]
MLHRYALTGLGPAVCSFQSFFQSSLGLLVRIWDPDSGVSVLMPAAAGAAGLPFWHPFEGGLLSFLFVNVSVLSLGSGMAMCYCMKQNRSVKKDTGWSPEAWKRRRRRGAGWRQTDSSSEPSCQQALVVRFTAIRSRAGI